MVKQNAFLTPPILFQMLQLSRVNTDLKQGSKNDSERSETRGVCLIWQLGLMPHGTSSSDGEGTAPSPSSSV